MSQSIQNQNDAPSFWAIAKTLVTGGIAGAAGDASSLPALNVKNQFQANMGNITGIQKSKVIFSNMVRNPRMFVTGFVPMTTSIFPATAQSYAVTNSAKYRFSKGGKKTLSEIQLMLISGAAGFLSFTFTTPSEVLFIKMGQNKTGVIETAKATIAKHGLKGMYRGALFTGTRDTIFTIADQVFAEKHPFLAAFVGAVISHPADTWKTKMQQDYALRITPRTLFNINPFMGLIPRVVGYICYMNVAPRVRKAIE